MIIMSMVMAAKRLTPSSFGLNIFRVENGITISDFPIPLEYLYSKSEYYFWNPI